MSWKNWFRIGWIALQMDFGRAGVWGGVGEEWGEGGRGGSFITFCRHYDQSTVEEVFWRILSGLAVISPN